jgi:hypothetical protein
MYRSGVRVTGRRNGARALQEADRHRSEDAERSECGFFLECKGGF